MRKEPCRHCGTLIDARGHSTHERSCLAPYSLERLYEVLGVVETPGPLDTPCQMPTRMVHGWKAHRLVYLAIVGPLPDDKPMVTHRCDNNPCVALDHMVPGDSFSNMREASERRRFRPDRQSWGNNPSSQVAARKAGNQTRSRRAAEQVFTCTTCGATGSLATGDFIKHEVGDGALWTRVCASCGHYWNSGARRRKPVKYQCECGLVSSKRGMSRHVRASGHTGRKNMI